MKTTKATYIGRRQTVRRSLAYFWLFEGDNKQRGYKKQIAPATIGETWLITQDKDDSIHIRGEHKPQRVGNSSDKSRLDWSALDAAHYQANVEERENKKLAKRADLFERSLAPLRLMANSLNSHVDRAAFIQRVVTELWRHKS